tara:strand:+ start:548 stop:2128 length:1581 start_codon:yes stop_codon:yes gene_type:complete
MSKIKIGIITNGNLVDKYTYEFAIWLNTNRKNFNFKHIVSIPKEKKNLEKNKIFKKILFRLIILSESLIIKLKKNHKNHLKKYNIRNIVKKELKVEINKKNNFNKKDLQIIKNERFDILIRSCGNILNNDFLKITKYGIISFHHGDYEKFRGSPAGFWEVFNKEKKTGFMLQVINKKLDYGNIILEGFFQTKSFFLLNQAELYRKSNYYLKKILLDFYKKRKFSFLKKRKKGKVYEIPKIYNQVKYIIETTKILIKKIFYKQKDFKLALFKSDNFSNPLIIENDKDKFLADPFLIKNKNKIYCFAEEFDYTKKRGHIVCIEFNKEQNKKKIILNEKFHLSFPYIFKFKNYFFMCPDTSDISEIRLYKCTNFPFKWKFYKTIKKNLEAVDNIIFKKNNLWWLITNIDRSKSNDFSHDLSVFYSQQGPLTNNWKSHSKNPIKINSLESRNAGLIIDKNKIIRVSQVQGFDNYGENINFHEIKILNSKEYIENKIKNKNYLKIKRILNNSDIHHLSKINNSIIVDFKSN